MYSLLENFIVYIINTFNFFFLSKKNVVGLALGFKFIKEIDTKEPCLHVFVNKKIPINNLYKHDIIPEKFFNIKIDVIEIGYFQYSNDTTTPPPNFSSRIRPIQAGYSIGSSLKRTSGTLGAIVFHNENNTPHILTNNHLIAHYNQYEKGTTVVQPGDGSNSQENIIASLSNFIELKFQKTMMGFANANVADAAIAKLSDEIEYDKNIYKIGEVIGTSKISLGKTVRKVGKKTGYTHSTIKSINAFCPTEPEKGKFCTFKNQIVAKKFSDSGDSGSLVVDENNNAIGLIFGTTKDVTFINPIEEITKVFNIHF